MDGHDPICQKRNPHHVLPGECVCDVIAAARADQRDRIVARIVAQQTPSNAYDSDNSLGYESGLKKAEMLAQFTPVTPE